jgi:hypothetical protein
MPNMNLKTPRVLKIREISLKNRPVEFHQGEAQRVETPLCLQALRSSNSAPVGRLR